jgi:O-antigen/teichoic acid export membrane protein
MKAAKQAAAGGILVFIGNTSSTVVLSVASIIIARLLGPSEYGMYSIALITPSLLFLFTDFGVNPALVRFLARFRAEGKSGSVKNLIKAGLYFEVLVGLLVFLISLFFSDIFATFFVNRPDMTRLIQISSPVVLGSALLATSNAIFVGLNEMGKAALLSVLSSGIKLVAAPTLVVLGFGVVGALAGHVLGPMIGGAIGILVVLVFCRSDTCYKKTGSDLTSNLRRLVGFGMPLYGSNIIRGLLSYHTIILAWFTSNVEIGNYSVAVMFAEIIALITTPISTALFPAFSGIGLQSDSNGLRNLFLYSLRYTFLLVMPASVFIAVSSGDLVSVFYGPSYQQAPLYLGIYSMNFLLVGFTVVFGGFFNGIGRSDVSLKAALIQLCTTISLSLVFAGLYGVTGFICATVMSGTLATIYLSWIATSQYGLKFDPKRIGQILLASTLSAVPTFLSTMLFRLPLVRLTLAIVVFTATYSTVSPILGAIRHDDLTNLMQICGDTGMISRLSKMVVCYEERVLSVLCDRPTGDMSDP